MAKTTFNCYQGVRKRRKNKIIVTQTAVQEATVVARPEVNTEEENGQSKSASLKKLAFFNLELDAMVKEKENLEEQVTDGFLGIEAGQFLLRGALEQSIERIKKAKKRSSKVEKQKRKQLKYVKAKTQRAKKTKEGQTYQAGSY
eukprot:gene2047-2325_t